MVASDGLKVLYLSAEVVPFAKTGGLADVAGALPLALPDGEVREVGDSRERFSIQSVSKVYTLTLALKAVGGELWKRVDREPSGDPFNSLVQLEYEKGIPRNPFMNAGALVTSDVVLSNYDDAEATLLEFIRKRSGNPEVGSDEVVAKSERESGHRNVALANFIRSYGNLHNDVQRVLDFYYRQCSLHMDCVDLARSVQFLADGGRCIPNSI